MFATIIFLLITALMLAVQYLKERSIINLITLLTGPYFFIVLLNNVFFYRFGFYKISERTLYMLLGAHVCFFCGSCLVMPGKLPVIRERDNAERFSRYRMTPMIFTTLVIGIIGLFKIGYYIYHGKFSKMEFADSEGLMGSGFHAHLLLMSMSIIPIIFMYWLEHKEDVLSLLSVALIIGEFFASFIKYNVIGPVVCIFIFVGIYKKSVWKKATIILTLCVAFLFCLNYMIGFTITERDAQYTFYLNHFWKYIAGSSIYDDYIFQRGFYPELTIGYKFMTFLMAIPNMFLGRIFGMEKLFPHHAKPYMPISSGYEGSNVTDAFGYLFPSKGDVLDIVIYYMAIFFIGFLFAFVYVYAKAGRRYFNTFICNFLTYFVFFSFFGTFYISSVPWECLVYSVLLPWLFIRRSNPTIKGVLILYDSYAVRSRRYRKRKRKRKG